MIQKANTTQVLRALPEGKAEEKKARTKSGTVLVLLGLVLVVIGFAMALRLIESAAGLTVTGVIVVLGPMGSGALLGIVGATVWSGELVTAGFRDAIATVRGLVGAFRKGDEP